MIEISGGIVYRRLRNRGELSTREVELVWEAVFVDLVPVVRTLIDAESGEILDEVGLDGSGRVASYEATVVARRSEAPDGLETVGVEPVQTRLAAADDQVIEDGGDDRALPVKGSPVQRSRRPVFWPTWPSRTEWRLSLASCLLAALSRRSIGSLAASHSARVISRLPQAVASSSS
ncbi:MAG: hypothetical protein ACXVZ1_05800 [Gaiellaceae bacterium]